MASIIRVKRSTGTTAPGSLQFGELGLTIGTGTQANKGERLFVGDNSGNVDVVGGRYFTDLMVHAPGTVTSVTNPTTAANGFVAILDQNRKVDEWNVDNLTLNGNTFSSTNTNGDINIDPNGSGEIVIPDDTFLTFGTGKDSKIEYDENGTDQLNITGADVRINITTQSNSKDTGALIVEGGVGIEKNLNVGGNLAITGIVTFSDHIRLPDSKEIRLGNDNDLKLVHNGTDSVISNTTNDLNITNTGDDINITAADDFVVKVQGSENAITAIGDGAVSLFFDNAAKIATRIDGVEVTGTTDTDNLVVSGVATVASAKISDLTNNRIVLAGTAGELEDDANLTFDGSQLSVVGIITHVGKMVNTGGIEIDSVGISSNIISTKQGHGNLLYIDPYPDGLSNEGTVIVKGDLQVDGTTTTVDSFTVNLNDPIINLGVTTSTRTVMMTALAGVSTIKLDTTAGINTGDSISGTNIASGTTISTYDLNEALVTITNAVQVGGIATTTQLTVTANVDTNTDRGVAFGYNTSSGSGNQKQGFFGYHDLGGDASNAPERSFTYIPDATIVNNLVSGTKGFLDIKGIYFQNGDYDTTGNGIVYFDTTGKQVGAAGTAAGITTSNFILTTDVNNIPKWTTTIDGGSF